MKKVDDPDSELFHLDRYMVLDEGEQEFDDGDEREAESS